MVFSLILSQIIKIVNGLISITCFLDKKLQKVLDNEIFLWYYSLNRIEIRGADTVG